LTIREYIFLSAHLDDAVLSCAGMIKRLRDQHYKVGVVTVFAGIPMLKAPPSQLIEEFHRLMGSSSRLVAQRRAEDRRALALLGAKCIQLNFLDCIYRRDLASGEYYLKDMAEITGAIKEQDVLLPAQIAQALRSLYPKRERLYLYAPLAVGYHLDHRLLNRAALILLDQGYRLGLYEDYPYAEKDGATEEALRNLRQKELWHEKRVFLSKAESEAKIKAVMCYQSQLRMLFKDEAVVHDRILGFLSQRGGERFWEYQTQP